MRNYPNPFNSETCIEFTIPSNYEGKVKVAVYNSSGSLVKELLNTSNLSSGIHSVRFNESVFLPR